MFCNNYSNLRTCFTVLSYITHFIYYYFLSLEHRKRIFPCTSGNEYLGVASCTMEFDREVDACSVHYIVNYSSMVKFSIVYENIAERVDQSKCKIMYNRTL